MQQNLERNSLSSLVKKGKKVALIKSLINGIEKKTHLGCAMKDWSKVDQICELIKGWEYWIE